MRIVEAITELDEVLSEDGNVPIFIYFNDKCVLQEDNPDSEVES
jgi:hypothetical protein